VRHKHLIGQTLPCPKCQQPVHVVPLEDPLFPSPIPETIPGAHPARPVAVNSEAITKADPADWDVEQLVTQPFDNPAPLLPEAEPPPQPPTRVAQKESGPLSQRNPGSWQSRDALARRNILLVSLIGACGLLLAGVAFFVFIRWMGKPSERVALNPPGIQEPIPNKPIDESKGPDAAIEAPSPSIDPKDAEPTTDNPQSEKPGVDANPVENPPNGNLPATLVPEATLAPQGESPENPPVAPDQAGIEEKLPSVFEDFQRWIDAPSRGNWDDVGKADQTIEDEIALENAEILSREEYFPPAIQIPNWLERSERSLTSVKTQPMSLLRCIHWFSQVSNAGITADWVELNLAGVDFSEPIVIEGQNCSVKELIDQFCQQHGLELALDDSGFPHIRPSQERLLALKGPDGVLNTDQWVDELPMANRDAWVPLLIRMLDLSQCQYAQGRLEWTGNESLYDRARFIASLQAMKDAAKEPSAEFQFPGNSFDFVRPEAWWALRERVQARMPMDRILHEERPVIDLIAMACEASGTHLVIDWPAAWSHGLHPSRLSMSIVRGRTLEEIANRYLEDYAMELIPLDSRTVLLTTDSVRRSIEQVVPVRLDRGMAIEDIKGAVRSIVPRGPDLRSRFRWETVPGKEQLALLRICLPALVHLRDTELQRAFGFQSPNEKMERE
jgi:hypothetical protein